MAFRVMKPIAANGELIATGTLVDASKWRNLRALINNRYLVEVFDQTVNQPVEQPVVQIVQTIVDKPEPAKKPKIKATTKTKVISK